MNARIVSDPASLEDKIVRAYENAGVSLAPWEIAEIAHKVLARFPEAAQVGGTDVLFELVYDAISEALEKAQNG